MFQNLATLIYTASVPGSIAISDNTDFSIDGSSKKIVFSNALNGYVTVGFTQVNFADFDELVFHAYVKKEVAIEQYFKITIGSDDYIPDFTDQLRDSFKAIIIDCSGYGNVSSIKITALIADLTMFFDYIGVRKATVDTIDEDVLKALKDHISLDYKVGTTLGESAVSATRTIKLSAIDNIFENTKIRITGGGKTEDVNISGIKDGSGTPVKYETLLENALVNSYSSGTTVEALCPVEYGEDIKISNDPVIGIVKASQLVDKQYDNDGLKLKQYLGNLIVHIYIECSKKNKLEALCRQFESKYGERFQFLLDGEYVEIYCSDSHYIGAELGGLPRMVYIYSIPPQPVTTSTGQPMSDITLNMESQ